MRMRMRVIRVRMKGRKIVHTGFTDKLSSAVVDTQMYTNMQAYAHTHTYTSHLHTDMQSNMRQSD